MPAEYLKSLSRRPQSDRTQVLCIDETNSKVPEEVDVAVAAVDLIDPLFEIRDTPALDAAAFHSRENASTQSLISFHERDMACASEAEGIRRVGL